MANGHKQLKKQRQKLFILQEGRCFWCDCQMVQSWEHATEKSPPDNLATLEHLDSRNSGRRGKFVDSKQIRHVVACHKCNSGNRLDKSTYIDILCRVNELFGSFIITQEQLGQVTLCATT